MTSALTKAEVVTLYSRTAPRYDLWARLTEMRARQRVLAVAAIRDGEAVLEVAVGTGLLFVELLKQNPHGRNDGLDLTAAMLAEARAKAERSGTRNWQLRVGDAYALDYPDVAFDILISCYMFDLLPAGDFDRVLAEFRRVLRPGGRLVLANLAPTRRPTYQLWELLYRMNPKWVGGCRGVELAEPLRRARFVVESRVSVSQLAMVSEVIHAVRP